MKIQLGEGGRLPFRGNVGDAGFDLYVSEHTVVAPRSFSLIPSAIRIQMPDDMWYLILGRSSASNKLGLIVIPAVIDAGFRGVLFANVYNTNMKEVVLEEGDRVAQIVPYELLAHRLEPVVVDALDSSDRGEGGFGSSGR